MPAPTSILAFTASALIATSPSTAPSPESSSGYNPYSHCGTERWDVKTLDDPGVNHIRQTAKRTTIHSLVRLTAPSNYSRENDTLRYQPVEYTKYTVPAVVVGFKEEDDRDLHVVIADPSSGETMIAEIPDPKCATVVAGGHAAQIAGARKTFLDCFGQPLSGERFERFTTHVTATVTGVGFFDYIHPTPQTGVAPNAIELHPVTAIAVASCPPGTP